MSSPMTHSIEMLDLLEQWVNRGWLRELDLALVRFFLRKRQTSNRPSCWRQR
jgi:exodeoxyribonuclease V alpha subunit